MEVYQLMYLLRIAQQEKNKLTIGLNLLKEKKND